MINKKATELNSSYEVSRLICKGVITPSQALVMYREADDKNQADNLVEEERLEDIMKELEELIGLDEVKQIVKEIQAYIEIQKRRKKENLTAQPQVLHMIFKGNPGTGKTTVARLLGKMFKHMKVLNKGHTVEIERADLVGEYIGHTAQKTREQIKRALGGILFIDEAYSLARGGEKDFGKEAIDVLVKAMEDYKNDFIVILAGYKDEMDKFLKVNPGLRSRFPIKIEFNDYTIDELILIAKLMAQKKEYTLSSEALDKLKLILQDSKSNGNYSKMGNARLVRNILEKSIRLQALRLINKVTTRDDLLYIEPEDIPEVQDF